jgi:hypothetical protein
MLHCCRAMRVAIHDGPGAAACMQAGLFGTSGHGQAMSGHGQAMQTVCVAVCSAALAGASCGRMMPLSQAAGCAGVQVRRVLGVPAAGRLRCGGGAAG